MIESIKIDEDYKELLIPACFEILDILYCDSSWFDFESSIDDLRDRATAFLEAEIDKFNEKYAVYCANAEVNNV